MDNLAVTNLDFSAGTVGDQRIFEGNIEPGWEGVDIGPKISLYFKKPLSTNNFVEWTHGYF